MQNEDSECTIHFGELLPNASGKQTPILRFKFYTMARPDVVEIGNISVVQQTKRWATVSFKASDITLESGTYLYKVWNIDDVPQEKNVLRSGLAYVTDTLNGSADTLKTSDYTFYYEG
jgi:hypothetical protein